MTLLIACTEWITFDWLNSYKYNICHDIINEMYHFYTAFLKFYDYNSNKNSLA